MEYKRLTKKGGWHEDIDLKDEYGYKWIYQRLAELEDQIENGTLIELPCKVGDTVYQVNSLYGVLERRVESLQTLIWLKERDMFGEWLFLTKAEAEQKLKELKDERKAKR